ncbi:PTS transporter subunit EIIC [Mesobacillus stamsii]|uniref:Phosphotransferase system glucose/maltose/N-acetylglucosamine-specific IIC component n=1 Tax=Mesobacillus stamsii TaxID=225347 RepID=A0ABU0FRH0_9BACI|nr:PTS transporter subunit EIIC [Mesobacillus stamsii]MDQ0412226.1 phosphotransferase system glucose/maltose/N-acetylglucosamine-specific IIC component [Mesobacillus stamsii]
MQNPVIARLSEGMLQVGLSLFTNLPIIFALGIAIGLSGGSGIAALAALLGYIHHEPNDFFCLEHHPRNGSKERGIWDGIGNTNP